MEVVFGTLAVVAVLALVAWAVVLSRRQAAAVEASWGDFARRGGYRRIEASGPWYARKCSRIAGESGGVAFELDRYTVSSGKSQVMYSRARVRTQRPVKERVIAVRRSWHARIDTAFRGPIAELGERAFDQDMLLRTKAPKLAREVLDERARKLLLSFERSPYFEASGNELKLCWRGAERDPRVLAAAVEVVVAAAIAHARA